MPGGTDGINRWWDSGGELFGIVCYMRGEVSVTRCPTLLPPTRHGCKSLPDTPYKEPNEMREKIIRYEPAGRGILSIKDAFYLAGSSSCLLAPPVPSPPSSFSLPSPRDHLPSSLFSPLVPPFVILFAAQTRRSNLLPRITQRLFLSRHRSAHSLPSSAEEINQEDISMVYTACVHLF